MGKRLRPLTHKAFLFMEVWKDVLGYEGYYQVSNLGRVKSLDREIIHKRYGTQKLKGFILKDRLNHKGYLVSTFSKNGKNKEFFNHRLVLINFLGINNIKPQVNHIDKNKQNNNLYNLEWVDNRENQCHKNINKTSKYTGVSFDKVRNKWVAQICIDKKTISLGRFENENEAKEFYDIFCVHNNIINKYNG